MKAIINKDKTIDDIYEFYEYAVNHDLDMYDGNHCETKVASFVSSKNSSKLLFEYSDFVECKMFEEMIKPHCVYFKPKLFGYDKPFIKAPKELKEELNKLRRGNEPFVDVIWRLLAYYHFR